SLFPTGLDKLSVLFDQGVPQPIRVVVEFKGVASFQAGVPAVDLGVIGRQDAFDVIVCDLDVQVAAHATVSTYRAHTLFCNGRLGLVNIRYRRGRTGLGASSA